MKPASSDVDVYDTTLRDGTQREGISLAVSDKLRIALHLYNVEADVDTLLDALTRNRSLLA